MPSPGVIHLLYDYPAHPGIPQMQYLCPAPKKKLCVREAAKYARILRVEQTFGRSLMEKAGAWRSQDPGPICAARLAYATRVVVWFC